MPAPPQAYIEDNPEHFGEILIVLEKLDPKQIGVDYREVVDLVEAKIDPEDIDRLRELEANSARVAYKAGRLHALAVRELDKVKERVKYWHALWADEANEVLAQDKKAGRIAKQISEKMIADYARTEKAEAWNKLAEEKRRATVSAQELEQLFGMARERMWNLRTLCGGGGNSQSQAFRSASAEAGRGR